MRRSRGPIALSPDFRRQEWRSPFQRANTSGTKPSREAQTKDTPRSIFRRAKSVGKSPLAKVVLRNYAPVISPLPSWDEDDIPPGEITVHSSMSLMVGPIGQSRLDRRGAPSERRRLQTFFVCSVLFISVAGYIGCFAAFGIRARDVAEIFSQTVRGGVPAVNPWETECTDSSILGISALARGGETRQLADTLQGGDPPGSNLPLSHTVLGRLRSKDECIVDRRPRPPPHPVLENSNDTNGPLPLYMFQAVDEDQVMGIAATFLFPRQG